jgi:rSAM/selenodomain-associated transferase 1
VRPVVIVFARLPVLGRVKTRLAAGIGDAAALAFHRATLARTLRIVARGPWRVELCVTPDGALRRHRVWSPPGGARLTKQGRGDLGARMGRALGRHRGPALLVGCDIPEMAPAHLRAAFARLGTHDAVFCPATDGGFWAVGFRRGGLVGAAFARVRWSGPHALADCLANLPHRRTARGALLHDVDDRADYEAWRRRERNDAG